ncbi:creatininase family protein [Thioalkalivibrio halophilus]|uniref:Creatininase n=1 Tax=Thioalkalivibrio halophilus TaxID=252474 RepID=A0A1V2ZWL9_9GAMM|nr:creatininase family protein [Thioalkalivibrio halophilus]OOC09469.1 creatininase [Thioalkalivibrio halophilus]
MPDPDAPRPLPRWQDLTTAEAAELAGRDPVAVLPLAAIEQHGPHLPLDTDLRIGEGLLQAAWAQLPADFPLLALPPLTILASPEHARFAGTLSLTPETAIRVLVETGRAVAGAGVRRLVLHNSHGGNRAVADTAALELRRRQRMLIVRHHYFLQDPPAQAGIPAAECRHGLHGGRIETAMMRHLAPASVHDAEARHAGSLGEELEASLEVLRPEGAAGFAWLAGDLNPAGTTGNAAAATAAEGAALVDHYATHLAAALRDARAFPLDRLA